MTDPSYLIDRLEKADAEVERLTALYDQMVRVNGNMKIESDSLTARNKVLEDELTLLKRIPMYVKPYSAEESRCVACDCTEEHQLHDPCCPVEAYQAIATQQEPPEIFEGTKDALDRLSVDSGWRDG